jgi:hypothetical protein
MHRSEEVCCAGVGMILCSLRILGLRRLLEWKSLRLRCVHLAYSPNSPFSIRAKDMVLVMYCCVLDHAEPDLEVAETISRLCSGTSIVHCSVSVAR